MKPFLRIAACLLLLALTAACVFYWNPLLVNDQTIRYHLWRAGVRSEYITVKGNRIHYFEALPPKGSPARPLVLIHGLGSRGEDWAPLIPSLAAAGFHVYAPDLLGFGRSDKPSVVYGIQLEEDDVVDYMHALNLTHADLDGWSMGGWIASAVALDYPELVDRLVLDDAAGITFQPMFLRNAFVPTDAEGLASLQALLSPHPAALPPFVVRAILGRIDDNATVIQEAMDSMESGRDLLDTNLAYITQPTLIVWGAEDRLIPISVGKTMHSDIPNSVLETVTGCGHLAPKECPTPVLAATIQFLTANPPPPRGERTLPGN